MIIPEAVRSRIAANAIMAIPTRQTYGSQSLHSAAIAELPRTNWCGFSANLPHSRLQFQREICKICKMCAFCAILSQTKTPLSRTAFPTNILEEPITGRDLGAAQNRLNIHAHNDRNILARQAITPRLYPVFRQTHQGR